ncbi:MAG: PaaI family thioesterase [Chlorobi bacterium]|nr:PaaI family thioesterase [Chlorobiota bacterium]
MQTDDTPTVASAGIWTPKTPNFRSIIEQCLERQEFMKHIGCKLTTIEPGYVEARIVLDRHHQQHNGLVHGGVIATIADVVAGFAAYTLVDENQTTVTVDLMLSFVEAARGSELRASGRVIRHGATTSFARAEVYAGDSSQQLVAIAQATLAIRNLS